VSDSHPPQHEQREISLELLTRFEWDVPPNNVNNS
jgi:hypothetical protein